VPATSLVIADLDDLHARVGEELGVSSWLDVTQEDVSAFARITGDEYWLHTDPDRAAQTPFGGTIAHGFFTLSLAPRFMYEVLTVDGIAMTVNYGMQRVRFPAPLPVGSRVRMRIRLESLEDAEDGATSTMLLTFEREGSVKPVCVAEWLGRYFRRTS
jgi:acyl dehydratase